MVSKPFKMIAIITLLTASIYADDTMEKLNLVLENQNVIVSNQNTIIANQNIIITNQNKLDQILVNQEVLIERTQK